jgi:hypothetical protein
MNGGRGESLSYARNASADLTPSQAAQLAKAVKEEFSNEAEDV